MATNQYGDVALNLNGYTIGGVKNLSLSESQAVTPVKLLGNISYRREFTVPAQGRLSYSQYSFYNDPFFVYATGGVPVSGGIYRNNFTTLFKSGLIESYEVSCSVGDFPETSISVLILGDFFTGQANTNPFALINSYPSASIVRPKNIELSGFNSGYNFPNQFTYSVSIENEVVYYTNKWGVGDYKIKKPVVAQLSVVMDSIDYRTSGYHEYLSGPEMRDMNIILKDCHNSTVMTLPIKSGILLNEDYSLSAGGKEIVTLKYEGFVDVI